MSNQPQTTRDERIEIVNKIIAEIASRGRRFLYCDRDGDCGRFEHDGKTLWYFDAPTGKRIYPYMRTDSHKFSGGGTLWALINDMRQFVITGKPSNGIHGYGGLYCGAWGYPAEDIDAVRQLAIDLGYMGDSRTEYQRHQERQGA